MFNMSCEFTTMKDDRVKKRSSCYEEEIKFKPSTELIPDEYEQTSEDSLSVQVFRSSLLAHEDDCEDFLNAFQHLGYKKPNFYLMEGIHAVNDTLEKIRQNSLNTDGLILLFIGTFFKGDGKFILDDGRTLAFVDIWSNFTATNCPGLKNKPKIFIFFGSEVASLTQEDSAKHYTAAFDEVYDIPAEADMLIIYKRRELGEEFFEDLCHNMVRHGKKYDIIDLITSASTNKRPPLIISTMTRRFFVTPSFERGHHLSIVEKHSDVTSTLDNVVGKIEKIHETHTKKKEKKGLRLFSFRRKNEEKPIIKKTETDSGEETKYGSVMNDSKATSENKARPSRLRKISVISVGSDGRSRNHSLSDTGKKLQPERPRWKY